MFKELRLLSLGIGGGGGPADGGPKKKKQGHKHVSGAWGIIFCVFSTEKKIGKWTVRLSGIAGPSEEEPPPPPANRTSLTAVTPKSPFRTNRRSVLPRAVSPTPHPAGCDNIDDNNSQPDEEVVSSLSTIVSSSSLPNELSPVSSQRSSVKKKRFAV